MELTDSDLTLRDFARTLSRRRTVLVVTLALVFLGGVFYSVVAKRKYSATTTIQLQKTNTDSLNLASMIGDAAGGATDALSANIDLETQVGILESDQLALRVIKDEKLENNKDFRIHFDLPSYLLSLFTPRGTTDDAGRDLDHSPGRRERLLRIFHANLKVAPVSGTRLINIVYTNEDPAVAAAVANDLVVNLTEYSFQTKFNATNEASKWLESQLGDLRERSEKLQSKLVEMQKSTGLFGLGESDAQGKPIVYSPVLDSLQQDNAALTQAETNHTLKGSIASVAKMGDADLISQLSGTTMAVAASQGVSNSLDLISNLRQQEANLAEQVSRDSTVFGQSYPRLVEEKAALTQVQKSLTEEIRRIGERAQNDYQISGKAVQELRSRYEAEKHEAEKLNDRTIDYVISAREAEQSETLYRDLLTRLREAGILEGLRSSNIAVVNPALTPAKPTRPNIPLILGLGLFAGIAGGIAFAFLVDAIDNKIQGPDEIEAQGIPLLGLVPVFDQAEDTIPEFLAKPNSPHSESIRALRSTLLISRQGSPPRLIMVTSGAASEGKSTISVNLAMSLAQLNKRVLLVEIDLRRPVLDRRFGFALKGGLASYLTDSSLPITVRTLEGQPNLSIITSGPTPPFPAELLASSRMLELMEEWKREYDFVVLDAPPILPVADAQSLIEHVDSTIIVVRAGRTSRTTVDRTTKVVAAHQARTLNASTGVVLNAVSSRSSAYYGYYGYGYKGDYYGNYGNKDATK